MATELNTPMTLITQVHNTMIQQIEHNHWVVLHKAEDLPMHCIADTHTYLPAWEETRHSNTCSPLTLEQKSEGFLPAS